MVANRRLATIRGVSEEGCLEIDKIHLESEAFIESALQGHFTDRFVYETLRDFDFKLQEMWEFPIDEKYHTLYNSFKFKRLWAGRVFRCKESGATFEIPPTVVPKDFYQVGHGYVDVGDSYYSRFGGAIEEIEFIDGGYVILSEN